jgi:1-deoxy-D-xylulose-5-phosphate reductoisomerase
VSEGGAAGTAPAQRSVAVLGSTGSIGTQALQVVGEHPERFRVGALAAGRNAGLVIEQARSHGVGLVAMADAAAAREVRAALGGRVEVLEGPEGVAEVAGSGADVVVNGLVGSLGLVPTLAALQAGSRLALANKESLIVGGDLVLAAAAPGQLVPVDSEHSALAQCLRGGSPEEVARLVVTASGGPFRGRSREELESVTAAEALAHPTWDMGAVITINSATLANKGLEVIEAHLLFGVDYDRIEVVVHPQSIVHSMVEFHDGATIANLSPPDMRLPIQLALGWPERLASAPTRMDWTRAQALEFEPVDADTFRMLPLSVAAGRAGGTAPAVLNAANEEAVAAFLEGKIGFLGIADAVAAVLEEHDVEPAADLESVLGAERWARRRAREHLVRRTTSPAPTA